MTTTFLARERRPLALLAALALVACGPAEEQEEPDLATDDMDLFVATGKTDTGYVSDQAAELEAEISGVVTVDLTALPASERDRLLAAHRAGNKDAFKFFPTEQIKFGRTALKAQKFNANMENAPATIVRTELVGTTALKVTYTVVVESLVKNKDLPAGTTIASLVNKEVRLKLPANPKSAFAKGGVRCATDPDEPTATDAALTAEMTEQNYFFYWNPDRAGCPLTATGVAQVLYKVKNPAAAKVSYPEYDDLLKDKKITLVALFGQLEHGALLSGQNEEWDWGWIGYEDFTSWLETNGYKRVSVSPAGVRNMIQESSSRWSRKYSTNLTVEVDVISPLDLQDHADAARKDAIVKEAVRTHEIVYYNGHSFYGSLKVLDDPANFSPAYQIIFMDSCWSYAYYTKQVFTSKTTAADPTGMLMSDVLNNTEPGISGSHETFSIFLSKLFYASDQVARKLRSKAKNYTWRNLVTYMNTSAKKRAELAIRAGEHQEPEVYGVSGVATNRFKP
jgi:hypothetical protein